MKKTIKTETLDIEKSLDNDNKTPKKGFDVTEYQPTRITGKAEAAILLRQQQKKEQTNYLKFAIECSYRVEPINIRDIEAVKERIAWFFNKCVQIQAMPTISGLALALDVSTTTLKSWYSGSARKDTHEEIIVKAYRIIEMMWENGMANGTIPSIAGQFLGKNNFGYSDQREFVIKPSLPIGEGVKDNKQLQREYIEENDYIDK